MNILKELTIILGSLAISVVAGYFLYTFLEGTRLDLYCKEMREGLDCYQEDWVAFPVWLFSLIGSFISILSIATVSTLSSSPKSTKITLVVGSVIALPLTLAVSGPVAFMATVLSGFLALLVTLCLTRHSSKDALTHTV